ncbi:cytochrome P450 [Coprinopsis sp. MPI-PUGE-AT-0042]|nr:cytochrome P450 [Coprinopsis sp. MPI-PUGE-AT-0042]
MSLVTILVSLVVGCVVYQWLLFQITKWKVRNIPTIGGDGFISHYLTARKFAAEGHIMVEEGYRKYPNQAFKVATFTTENCWLIICNGPAMLEDIRKSSEDHLSFSDASLEILQMKHTLQNFSGIHDEYHVDLIRGPLTRGFPARLQDIRDEIATSFGDVVPVAEEWTAYPLLATVVPIVCRTTNRLFVGLPLCRNPDWIRINCTLTVHLFNVGNTLNKLPAFLRPIAVKWLCIYKKEYKTVKKHFAPLVEDRMKNDQELGPKYEGRPTPPPAYLRHVDDFTHRLIGLNFAAIHSTSSALTSCLFDLASHPEYIEPLCEEVQDIIRECGWTKDAMGRMRKLDSFLRESSRYGGTGSISVTRQARKDFKFSNGVVVPKGFRLVVPSSPVHLDPNVYPDAHTFKGFRFSDIRDGGDHSESLKHQMVHLEPNFLFFGYGRAACPGRFFAANEVKAMMAHILMTYDFRLADGVKESPKPHWISATRSPNAFAKMEFRKRQKV